MFELNGVFATTSEVNFIDISLPHLLQHTVILKYTIVLMYNNDFT